jgi:hypothetical protein
MSTGFAQENGLPVHGLDKPSPVDERTCRTPRQSVTKTGFPLSVEAFHTLCPAGCL